MKNFRWKLSPGICSCKTPYRQTSHVCISARFRGFFSRHDSAPEKEKIISLLVFLIILVSLLKAINRTNPMIPGKVRITDGILADAFFPMRFLVYSWLSYEWVSRKIWRLCTVIWIQFGRGYCGHLEFILSLLPRLLTIMAHAKATLDVFQTSWKMFIRPTHKYGCFWPIKARFSRLASVYPKPPPR